MWRHDRRALAIISMSGGAYVASVLLPFVNTHGWTGGWTPAGRFLVIVVPLLALPLAYGLRTAPRTVTATLLALQLAIDVYFWSAPKNLWNDGDGIAAVCERGPLRVCGWLPSFVGPDDKVMTVSE